MGSASHLPLVSQVDVTDPRGYVREVNFGPTGYVTSDTHALGQPEQQTVTYSYFSDNTLQSVTDALGRVTSFTYDANGNTTSVTRLSGTPNAVTTSFSYEPVFNLLASVTDPLNHTTSFGHDQSGNLVTATDPLNHQSSFAYNSLGQMVSSTDALNNTVQFGYTGGDLTSVTDPLNHTTTLSRDGLGNLTTITDPLGHQTTLTYNPQGLPISLTDAAGSAGQLSFEGSDVVGITDPLGNTSTRFVDGAGRVVLVTDGLGHTTRIRYNPLNQVVQVTDALQGVTSFAYDMNGNLLTLTDPLGDTTSWTYDDMDRVVTRTDALLRQASYTYDLNGNIASSTDRKGQVTSFTYDALNRTKLIGYNTVVNGGVTSYESTTSYTYDGLDRITQAVDSAGGTVTRSYDDLNRIFTETTAQGSISYAYDAAGRRASMTVGGQPQVTYSFDNANRLTGITQGSASVGFGYDNANRRSSLTLPNGVTVTYEYDNDSHITGMTYKFGTNTLGNLTRSYDPRGARTQVGGGFARTNLPGAVTSAVYDAANELTNWNGTALSYDANGNMLGDGHNTLTWNARNQVATLNGASLQYDAFGRRIKNAAGTSFLFDGANATQELAGLTVTANILSGGIDELFQRTDSNGTVVPLADALGSTIALTNFSGSIVTTYSYDPFGNTITAGAASSNPAQYTGRENEGNGLYYLRARYYSPVLGKFISEDPLGFRAGMNFYRYVDDAPTNFTDPSGLDKKNAVCSLLPQARTEGISGSGGLFSGPTGGIERVVNYNTGKVNIYGYGGVQVFFFNGVASGGVQTGLIFKQGSYQDTDYSGGFTSVSGSVTTAPVGVPFGSVGVYGSASSGGLSGGFEGLRPTPGGAKVVGVNANVALLPIGKVGVGGAATNYSQPLDAGNVFTYPDSNGSLQIFDLLMVLTRRLACK